VYAKRYRNKKGEEKVEILLSLDEAKRTVDLSPMDLLACIREALNESTEQEFKRRGTEGRLDGLAILFEGFDDGRADEDGPAGGQDVGAFDDQTDEEG
jgi:hypothetical protein